MTLTKCDICGKKFTEEDENEGYGIYQECCYGSKYDGSFIHIDMCTECFDKLIDNALENVLDKDECVREVDFDIEDYSEIFDDEDIDHGYYNEEEE